MAIIVTIDPGKTTGWAWGDSQCLQRAGTFDPDIGCRDSPRQVVDRLLATTPRRRTILVGRRLIENAFKHGLTMISGICIPTEITDVTIDLLVAEKPHLTSVGPETLEERTENLMVLAVRLGRLLRHIPHRRLVLVRPSQWKRQVPKPIHNRRVLSACLPYELAVIPNDHNAIDAVGLYQFARKELLHNV